MTTTAEALVGARVKVTRCNAKKHGDSIDCVCRFVGITVTVGKRHVTKAVGTPLYHIANSDRLIERDETKPNENHMIFSTFD